MRLGFKRSVDVSPLTVADRNAGITEVDFYPGRAVEITYLLEGDRGAVQFLIRVYPQEFPQPEENTHLKLMAPANWVRPPFPMDLGRHSPVPLRTSEEPYSAHCAVLGGRPCYYEGSGSRVTNLMGLLLMRGEDAMWRHLELYYTAVFWRGEGEESWGLVGGNG